MALKSPSVIYGELMNSQTDIIVNKEQASFIWAVFRRKALKPQRFADLRYLAFMQACLMSAIEASEAMSWIEALFRSSMKPNATVKGIIVALVKEGMQKYYNEKVGAPEKLYTSVINSIAWSHKSYFEDIDQGLGVMF